MSKFNPYSIPLGKSPFQEYIYFYEDLEIKEETVNETLEIPKTLDDKLEQLAQSKGVAKADLILVILERLHPYTDYHIESILETIKTKYNENNND